MSWKEEKKKLYKHTWKIALTTHNVIHEMVKPKNLHFDSLKIDVTN